MSFEKFRFHPEIMAGIRASNYVDPTSIQEQAIPPILEGKDVLGLAQTGTGKTAAFALPILQRLPRGERKHVRALVLAPTRELAEQIHEAIRTLGKKTRVSSMTLYGGVNIRPQIQSLKKGVEVVVACPGRLLDHIGQGTIRLSKLEVLVLDEADQMFDMGFLPDIRRILQHLPRQRQTLLFGATMPAEIRGLAREILVDPVTIQVGKTAPVVTVSHAVYPVQQHLKTPLLLKILGQTPTGSVLVPPGQSAGPRGLESSCRKPASRQPRCRAIFPKPAAGKRWKGFATVRTASSPPPISRRGESTFPRFPT